MLLCLDFSPQGDYWDIYSDWPPHSLTCAVLRTCSSSQTRFTNSQHRVPLSLVATAEAHADVNRGDHGHSWHTPFQYNIAIEAASHLLQGNLTKHHVIVAESFEKKVMQAAGKLPSRCMNAMCTCMEKAKATPQGHYMCTCMEKAKATPCPQTQQCDQKRPDKYIYI
jgi:hypothetical protein